LQNFLTSAKSTDSSNYVPIKNSGKICQNLANQQQQKNLSENF
jgi:hypothetical protein